MLGRIQPIPPLNPVHSLRSTQEFPTVSLFPHIASKFFNLSHRLMEEFILSMLQSSSRAFRETRMCCQPSATCGPNPAPLSDQRLWGGRPR